MSEAIDELQEIAGAIKQYRRCVDDLKAAIEAKYVSQIVIHCMYKNAIEAGYSQEQISEAIAEAIAERSE